MLRLQVLIAETDLRLATIHGEIVVIEFVESWGTEACRVSSTESEIARGIHQRRLRRQMVVERFMMGKAQS